MSSRAGAGGKAILGEEAKGREPRGSRPFKIVTLTNMVILRSLRSCRCGAVYTCSGSCLTRKIWMWMSVVSNQTYLANQNCTASPGHRDDLINARCSSSCKAYLHCRIGGNCIVYQVPVLIGDRYEPIRTTICHSDIYDKRDWSKIFSLRVGGASLHAYVTPWHV